MTYLESEIPQLTREEAIRAADAMVWVAWSDMERAIFQLIQDCMMMPFSEFHRAVERAHRQQHFDSGLVLCRATILQSLSQQEDAPTVARVLEMVEEARGTL